MEIVAANTFNDETRKLELRENARSQGRKTNPNANFKLYKQIYAAAGNSDSKF